MTEDIDEILEKTHINLQVTTNMFMQTNYLKWGADLFKEFEVTK